MNAELLTEQFIIAYEKALEMTQNPELSQVAAYVVSQLLLSQWEQQGNNSARNVSTLVANVLAINKRNEAKQKDKVDK